MGCHAVTPHLVSLAKRLEGRPFHLLATHCQNDTRENVVAFLKSKGLSESSPNFTLTSFGGHPKVKGNGHVPYYMVFDHRGQLVREHMCGDYHGGDGLGMVEWVEKMLLEAPDIYLGEEPYSKLSALAGDIQSGKKLPTHLKALEAALQSEDPIEAAEADRLMTKLSAWRDARLKNTTNRLATTPSSVVPGLKALAKDVKGSTLAAPIEEKIKELKATGDLKHGIKVEKAMKKATKRLDALKACKSCRRKGVRSFRMSCASCKSDHGSSIAKIKRGLEKLLVWNGELPIRARLQAFCNALD